MNNASEQMGTQFGVQLVASLKKDGCVRWPQLLTRTEILELANKTDGATRGRAGTRCLLNESWCKQLAHQLKQALINNMFLAPDSLAVQCTLFEKTLEHNWLVPLHQDLSIPVAHRNSAPQWRAWSQKEGLLFAQPPLSVLENSLALRLHLDPCDAEDGALRIIPGSHLLGIQLNPAPKPGAPFQSCSAREGDAWLMRPLVLHASSKRTTPGRRRVLHFLFGPATLPDGVEWPVWAKTA
ncbi:MAG: phytanoyl-CoA dioxygenase family protein [Hydrogenophaga sp.]